MEPLPSDVARVVLGYLSDTCPDVAAQFLAASPDLGEVRRMKPRARRPYRPSLVDILTEHATACSIVEDVDSAVKWLGAPNVNGDFIYKLRRLLAVIVGAQNGAVVEPSGSADSANRQPEDTGGGGVSPGREAATAGQWAVDPESMDDSDWDEAAPAVGGDCADTPAREAAVGDSLDRRESAGDSPDRREAACDSPTLEIDCDSPADRYVEDSEALPDVDTAHQTEMTSVDASRTQQDPEMETSSAEEAGEHVPGGDSRTGSGCSGDGALGGGGSGSGSGGVSGDDRRTTPKGGGSNRRKSRPPRRSDPEMLAAVLAGRRTGSQPMGWIFGQVRHCAPSGRAVAAPVVPEQNQRSQQWPEPIEPEPWLFGHDHDVTTSADRPAAESTSPPAETDLPESLSVHLSALPATSPTRPSTMPADLAARSSALPAGPSSRNTLPSCASVVPVRPSVLPACPDALSSVAGRRSARKKSVPRRRPLSQCGTTIVRPGAHRSRSPLYRLPAGLDGSQESPAREERASESPVKEDRVVESSPKADREPEPPSNRDRVTESSAMEVRTSEVPVDGVEVTESLAGRGRTAPLATADRLPWPSDVDCEALQSSPPPGGASVRSPSPEPTGSCQSPPPDVDSTPGSSPATSTASSVQSSPPDADSSVASSPPASVGGGLQPLPPGDFAVGASPTPSQLSGRSSQLSGRSSQLSGRSRQLSERSTPASERSLHICLTPQSGKTPSLGGSFRAGETPTSVRQSARRTTLTGGSSTSRRVSAPRRRLLADLRRRSESPQLPLDLSRQAQSTPSVSTAAARRVSGDSGAGEPPSGASRAAGLRRTPRRTVRGAGPLASTDLTNRPTPELTRGSGGKRPLPPTADRSPSPPVNMPSDGNKSLLKSINIMSFLSRIHSVGTS